MAPNGAAKVLGNGRGGQVLQTDRLVIYKIGQADEQRFLTSVGDGDEMAGYLNALPEDAVQGAWQDTNNKATSVPS